MVLPDSMKQEDGGEGGGEVLGLIALDTVEGAGGRVAWGRIAGRAARCCSASGGERQRVRRVVETDRDGVARIDGDPVVAGLIGSHGVP